MKETLTCNNCSKNWKRNKTRGRKPHYCPPCIKLLSSQPPSIYIKSVSTSSVKPLQKVLTVSDKPKTARKERQLIPAPSYWVCFSCKNCIGVEVGIFDPPTHKCEKKAKRSLALEKVSKEEFNQFHKKSFK